jgi:trk system potassium uptake protein TrkH
MLVPLMLSWWLGTARQSAYDEAFLLTFGDRAGLWWLRASEKRELKVRDGFLHGGAGVDLLPVFACLPLMLPSAAPQLPTPTSRPSPALTTTGATVLAGLDHLPPSINFWRTMLVWLGGMGLIVLAVAMLPLLGIGGRQMFKAETPGPMKDSNLTPRIAETAKGLWGSTFGGHRAVHPGLLGRNELVRCVMHAFSTMGLGGFSSHDASFGHWNSALPSRLVAVVLHADRGHEFRDHVLAVAGRSLRPYLQRSGGSLLPRRALAACSDIRLPAGRMFIPISDGVALRGVSTWCRSPPRWASPASITMWPMFAPLWMLFLGSFATCAGSTGGGIKMIRAIILYKQVYRELVRAMHPMRSGRRVSPICRWARRSSLPCWPSALSTCASIVALTLLMSASGLDILTAFSAVVACINNTGPGLNQVGPSSTFAVLTTSRPGSAVFAMLLGRLEIFTLLVVLTPSFWRR